MVADSKISFRQTKSLNFSRDENFSIFRENLWGKKHWKFFPRSFGVVLFQDKMLHLPKYLNESAITP